LNASITMQPVTMELTLATGGTTRFPRNWDETDVPTVSPRDLAAALRLSLSLGRTGREGNRDTARAPVEQAEQHVLALFREDPARALAVLLRLRGIVAALETRRFRKLAEGRDPAGMLRLVVVAASLRLNARRGFSPVRLAWDCTRGASDGGTAELGPAAMAA
jgi:hypothetical protein